MSNIRMTDRQVEEWTKILSEYYIDTKQYSKIKAEETISQILAECQLGWNRAPRDIDTRIKMKSGYQWKSHSNLNVNKSNPEEEVEEEVSVKNWEGSFFEAMGKKERDWWEDRKNTYETDFEFNQSSDKPLVEQLLFEELLQRRLLKLALAYPNNDYSKKITDSLKRVGEIQTKLGITREQRAGIMNKIDGNVAQIAVDLDKKLENLPQIEKEQYEEELRYNNLKKQRPPVNMLPPIEKVEALLGMDAKGKVDLNNVEISEITETVAKEISEINESKKEKKPKKVELSAGISLN